MQFAEPIRDLNDIERLKIYFIRGRFRDFFNGI